ncbi:hypothetical protein C5S42_10015 [Candidatus Methanomarinus sp.]|nr:hypothetical protein C5S42_10015 [ANME-2 cluster archaeon]
MTVGIRSPRSKVIDESLFGSQPNIATLYPSSAQAAAILDAVLLLPIPPFP